MVADLNYRHGMVTINLEASKFMDWDDRDGSNRRPIEESDKPEGYDDMKATDKDKHKYTLGELYNKGDWMKYANNMTAVGAQLYIHCIENKFVPYVAWSMKHHKIEKAEEDDEESQTSHSMSVGIIGEI